MYTLKYSVLLLYFIGKNLGILYIYLQKRNTFLEIKSQFIITYRRKN